MTVPADLAAAQTLPGCRNALDLMDRLENIAKTDIIRAVLLYTQWRDTTRLLGANTAMCARLWTEQYAVNGADGPLGYGGTSDPRGELQSRPGAVDQPVEEASHV